MPNKTIYVADADLAVFDRAQELAGENLSATIAQALRRFIETEEARTQGFGEITLKVGRQMTYTRKQFLGRELARHRVRDQETSRLLTQIVFQTARGRLVLYTRAQPDWTDWTAYWDFNWDKDWNVSVNWNWGAEPRQSGDQSGADAKAEDRAKAREEARARRDEGRQRQRQDRAAGRSGFDWSNLTEGGEYDMEVYETLDDLKPHIPDELYAAAARAMRGEDVEFLDI